MNDAPTTGQMDGARDSAAAHRMLQVAEREMQRVLLDIHDGPVQNMYAALSQLDLLRRTLGASEPMSPEAADRIDRIRLLLERGLTEIRTFIGELRSPAFDGVSLLQLLEGLVLQHESTTDTRVQLQVPAQDFDVNVSAKICMYRVVQEALSNAYRHGGATQVGVELQRQRTADADVLELTVRDNGGGFDVSAPLTADHFGIDGMRDRVEMIGGSFDVQSVVGGGTTVHVTLSLA